MFPESSVLTIGDVVLTAKGRFVACTITLVLIGALAGCGAKEGSIPPGQAEAPLSTLSRTPLAIGVQQTVISYVIAYDGDFQVLPASVADVYRNAEGIHILNTITGHESIYPPSATVTEEHTLVERQAGSKTVAFLGETCTTVDPAVEADKTQALAIVAPMLDGGGNGDNTGAISSSHSQCVAGGAEVGISFTVPTGYPSNVTVTMCTNQECYTFSNLAPGSSHNVSIYIEGASDDYFFSMGTIWNGEESYGIGSADTPGCSGGP